MNAPQGIQTAAYYDYSVKKKSSIEKNRMVKKDQEYLFNNKVLKHQEIIDKMEKIRKEFKISKEYISYKLNKSKGHYSGLTRYNISFTYQSYVQYSEFFNKLSNNKEYEPIVDPFIIKKPTPSNNLELTAEMCINFLKSTGEYKISKREITTNWVEL